MATAHPPSARHDMLRGIFSQPLALTPMLREMLAHTHETYGDVLPRRALDIVALVIARNHPAWNVVLAIVLIDLTPSLRARVVEMCDTPWTRLFLDYARERCMQLRSTSFTVANMHQLFYDLACDLSSTYLQHNHVLAEHVVHEAQSERALDMVAHAHATSADTLSLVLRQRAARERDAVAGSGPGPGPSPGSAPAGQVRLDRAGEHGQPGPAR